MPHCALFQLGCYFHTEMKAVPRFRDKRVKPLNYRLSGFTGQKIYGATHTIHLVLAVYPKERWVWTTPAAQSCGDSSNFCRREWISLYQEKLLTPSPLQPSSHFLLRQGGYCQVPKKAIIRLSPWGLLDLLFGLYGLRLRKMHKECDWQALPFETTRRQSQSPAGAASASPLHWRLQHKAMGDKKPICPLDNLPADVSMSVLVIYHAARPRVDFLLTGSQLFEVTPCSHLFPR